MARWLNRLPDDKSLDSAKLKAFGDATLYVAQIWLEFINVETIHP